MGEARVSEVRVRGGMGGKARVGAARNAEVRVGLDPHINLNSPWVF